LESHLVAAGDEKKMELLSVPFDGELAEVHDTSDKKVKAWLLEVAMCFTRDDLSYPVMLQCDSEGNCAGVVVALLLEILCVPEVLSSRLFLSSEGAERKHFDATIKGFRKKGNGVADYLSKRKDQEESSSVDVDRIRQFLAGGSFQAETEWLKQDTQLLCKQVQSTSKAGHAHCADLWRGEAAAAAAELAKRAPLAEAAAALFYRGWALAPLPGRQVEAGEALTLGLCLGELGNAKPQVLKKIENELGALRSRAYGEDPSLGWEEEISVVEVEKAADTEGSPHCGLMLLRLLHSGGQAEGSSAEESAQHQQHQQQSFWQAFPCPSAFSWLRCGALAAAATPEARHAPALEALGLSKRVDATVMVSARDDPLGHFESVVSDVAKALAGGEGCLLYCADGFGHSGVALACFAVAHGLDEPVRARPGQPKMTAPEAMEVLKALRPGSLASAEDEELVQAFAQNAWANHIQAAQRAFSKPMTSSAAPTSASRGSAGAAAGAGSSAPSSEPQRPVAPAGAKVVRQPGDGNCLFHSMAYGLGDGNASILRAAICTFMEQNPGLSIAGTPLTEWIQMLAGSEVNTYARKMAKGAQWGGAPEIACCAHLKKVNIHVYEERKKGAYELTVPFDVCGSRTISVLYVGGVHYDALAF